MAGQSRQQLEWHTKEQITKMSVLLGGKATKFNGKFWSNSTRNIPQQPLEADSGRDQNQQRNVEKMNPILIICRQPTDYRLQQIC